MGFFSRLNFQCGFLCGVVSVVMLYTLVGLGIITVVLRILGGSLHGSTNLGSYILVTAIWFSIGYAQFRGGHLTLDFVWQNMPKAWQEKLRFGAPGIMVCIVGYATVSSWSYAVASLLIREKMDGAPYYPIYPSKAAVAVAVSVLFAMCFSQFIKALMEIRGK